MNFGKSIRKLAASRAGVASGVAVWAVALGIGLVAMARYEVTPGAPAAAPVSWPPGTALTRGGDRPVVVMFVHPRCPCTRASIARFGEVMAGADGSVDAYVACYVPSNADKAWEESETWRTAASIPGVRVVRDSDGREARRFGASTSGQVFVFDAAGALLFEGGITAGRGQAGDNAWSAAVAALVRGREAGVSTAPVFGCALLAGAPCSRCGEEGTP
ncbi:MAG TPA: hypothetical protein VD971_13060 [Phycisphaerales bacterium]|nr:hypothetical protein [Phycisphaerales bacterium]